MQKEQNTVEQSELYYACRDEEHKEEVDTLVKKWLSKNYPKASWNILDAPNAFTQLFAGNKPYFEARFKPLNRQEGEDAFVALPEMLEQLPNQRWKRGDGLIREAAVDITLDNDKMALFHIARNRVEALLQELFGQFTITALKRFGEVKQVRFSSPAKTASQKLNTLLQLNDSALFVLNEFVHFSRDDGYKYITADKTGSYKSIIFSPDKQTDYTALQEEIRKTAALNGFSVAFTGQYFEDHTQLGKLTKIFFIVLVLLYFLLALEFENLLQPLVVMLTIPLGISGAMIILWLAGGTLNVMAAVGFIVVLGLIVDDPILKVETINRLRKQYGQGKMVRDPATLEKILHEAGEVCLKPLLMVSLTTTLALVPVLFISGMGNDLQKPLVWVIVGGLTIGTFFTTWFIPLAYWFTTRKSEKLKFGEV